ncbi:MAG TPA: division/cell wall cluster transcriptional repressor MraZ [Candidatus Elarobacter sp.]|nr:division/cell wall cluster transcriptional repressor MraZ [Candidatus Elarobacter sp.]
MSDRPLFTGSFEHTLDDKGRLVVPLRFRERLGGGFFLTIAHPDPCLAIYPAEYWSEIVARIGDAAVKDARYRSWVRYLFAHTEEINVDANGRLVIPPHLRAWAGIEKEAVLIGSMRRVELWAKDRYADHVRETGEIPDLTSELGLF